MFAVKTRAFLLGRGGTRGARGFPGGILYTEHASIHRVTIRFRCPAKLFYQENLGKRLSTDFARTCSRQLFDRSSSVLLRSVSLRFSERRIKRRADQIVGPILVSPHLSSYRICLSRGRDGRWYYDRGSRMILEVFRGGGRWWNFVWRWMIVELSSGVEWMRSIVR